MAVKKPRTKTPGGSRSSQRAWMTRRSRFGKTGFTTSGLKRIFGGIKLGQNITNVKTNFKKSGSQTTVSKRAKRAIVDKSVRKLTRNGNKYKSLVDKYNPRSVLSGKMSILKMNPMVRKWTFADLRERMSELGKFTHGFGSEGSYSTYAQQNERNARRYRTGVLGKRSLNIARHRGGGFKRF
jgi:hypothetical protein